MKKVTGDLLTYRKWDLARYIKQRSNMVRFGFRKLTRPRGQRYRLRRASLEAERLVK